MGEGPMQTQDAAVEASIRRFYENEARAISAEARATVAENEASRLKGQAEVLNAQKTKDDLEIAQLRSRLAEIDLNLRHIAGDFMQCLEQMRIGGYRRPGSRTSTEVIERALEDAPNASEARSAIHGLRAVEGELSAGGPDSSGGRGGGNGPDRAVVVKDGRIVEEIGAGGAAPPLEADEVGREETRLKAEELGARHGADNRPANWNEPLPPMPRPRNPPPPPRSKLLNGLLSSASALTANR